MKCASLANIIYITLFGVSVFLMKRTDLRTRPVKLLSSSNIPNWTQSFADWYADSKFTWWTVCPVEFLTTSSFLLPRSFLKGYGGLRRSEGCWKAASPVETADAASLEGRRWKEHPREGGKLSLKWNWRIFKTLLPCHFGKNFGFLMKGAKSNNMPNS